MDIQKFVQLRQYFHQHPETSFNEYQTREKIQEVLQESGLEQSNMRNCGITGLVADIIGKGPEAPHKRCVALRADMDALSMTEDNSTLPYCSQNAGAAHMCGHDSHMAMLLSASHYFLQKLDKIPSNYTIRLLFQPAEELGTGAAKMVEEGCLEGVDEVYGIHNVPNHDLGVLVCPDRGIMASCDVLEITISGQGGHGALPHNNNDVILTTACLIQALASVPSRDVDSQDSVVLTICKVTAGSTHNVMPDKAVIAGTLRTLDNEKRVKILKRVQEIVERVALTYNCEGKLQILNSIDAVINHPENAIKVRRAGSRVLGEDKVLSQGGQMVSEDFSQFIMNKPGAFFFLGNGPNFGMLHNPSYNINDELIEIGTKVWVALIEDLLELKLD